MSIMCGLKVVLLRSNQQKVKRKKGVLFSPPLSVANKEEETGKKKEVRM